MGCGCSQVSEDVKRYHEMIGSCDIIPSDMRKNKYSGLVRKINNYDYKYSGGYC